ncbi:MAG TPA: glycine zipper family protein [Aliidongia sp.]|uniref:glycine zipper family protein n=1 Tax=Aliidongia sp. TaxID=1914230 RepID=UPI002DDCE8AA|nr:glycine zipper family protein [Aliidongia sp.]HEV2676947.1 glycine zipper family protein [Aliidongia sp.]
MSRLSFSAALVGSLALGACVAAPPSGPAVTVMPGPGKTLAQFQQDDMGCRGYAQQTIGGGQSQEVANNNAVGSAVVGTGIGAAAGALLGAAAGNPGLGAAAGAGAGLLVGSSAGSANAQASGAELQHRYDVGYMQCMAAQGESVPPVQQVQQAAYPAYPYPAYPYPYPYPYAYGPGYYGPEVSVGFGFGGRRRW